MKLSIFLIALLLNTTIKGKKSNLRRQNEITCGEISPEYTLLTDLDSITPDLEGQKIMISHPIQTSSPNCLYELCGCSSSNPCCATCDISLKFGHIFLADSSGWIACGGTNCDYMDNCVYKDGDMVLVYGVVREGGVIQADEHCIDPFYIPPEDLEDEEDEDDSQGACKDLKDEYMIPGDMWCETYLGVAVWNGECADISGCSANGNTLFKSKDDCDAVCGRKKDDPNEIEEDEDSIDDQDAVQPIITISRPVNGTSSYIPYEVTKLCIQNTLQTNIYIPSYSAALTLQKEGNLTGSITYPQGWCDLGCTAVTVPPGKELYSDGLYFYFRGVGWYKVSVLGLRMRADFLFRYLNKIV